MTIDGTSEERAAPGPRLPLVALLVADALSLSGNAMGFVAIPWYVLETTGSATLTGVVAALTFAPTVLATFFGGGIVDRLGFPPHERAGRRRQRRHHRRRSRCST